MSNLEQTLSIIKPDAVERNLTEEIKSILIKNKLEIKEIKKIHITKDEAAEFYKVHQTKPFYNDLCSYLSSGPIVVMVLEGKNAVFSYRKIMGSTDPKQADNNTIRKLYGLSIDKNSVHGSDSLDNAKSEINFFFKGEYCLTFSNFCNCRKSLSLDTIKTGSDSDTTPFSLGSLLITRVAMISSASALFMCTTLYGKFSLISPLI